MKFEAKAGDLTAAAAFVVRAIEARIKIPILADILVEASGDKVTLTATDLDRMLRATCTADVEADGAVCVPADRLAGLLAGLDVDAVVKVETATAFAMTVSAGRSRYKLPSLLASDFPPPLSAGKDAVAFKLDASGVKRIFAELAFSISTEETRYYLNGIYLHTANDVLTSVATDGHRLARISIPMPGLLIPEGAIVPRAACANIAKLAGEVALRLSDRIIEATCGNRQIISKLIDGSFPDYARIIPQPSGNTVEVDRAELHAALVRAAAVAERAQGKKPAPAVVRLQWSAGELRLDLANDCGTDFISAKVSGTGGWFAVATGQMLDQLDALDAERVVFDAAAPKVPVLISVTDDADRLAVQMPYAWFDRQVAA